MSFKDNLIKARSHIVFLVALGAGLGLVTSLEQAMPEDPPAISASVMQPVPSERSAPAATSAPIRKFDDVEPLPLAITRTSLPADGHHARIAWKYFENNTHPDTGLVNSADQYPSTTMWETGSYFVAVISADLLGLIDTTEAEDRISRALDTLSTIRLFDDLLPNKAYNVRTSALVDYANKPVARGLGWSALDIARLVGTLGHVQNHYPNLSDDVAAVLDHWALDEMVDAGQLIGGNMTETGLRRDQEGRVGYGQYAAKAMMMFGFDMVHAYNAEANLMVSDVNGTEPDRVYRRAKSLEDKP